MKIHDYAATVAKHMGIHELKVSIVNGVRLGCTDMHLVSFESGGHLVSELIYHLDLDCLQSGTINDQIQQKIRRAMVKLKIMIAD